MPHNFPPNVNRLPTAQSITTDSSNAFDRTRFTAVDHLRAMSGESLGRGDALKWKAGGYPSRVCRCVTSRWACSFWGRSSTVLLSIAGFPRAAGMCQRPLYPREFRCAHRRWFNLAPSGAARDSGPSLPDIQGPADEMIGGSPGMKIEQKCAINAPPQRVWVVLTDPYQVVTCLPGATITDKINERT